MGFAVAAALFVVGTTISVRANKGAAEATQKASDRERRIAEVRNAKERRRAIAKSRQDTGSIINQGASSGGLGSSALGGGVASINADLGGNIGFSNKLTGLNNQRLSFLDSANSLTSKGQTGAAIASVGSAAMGASGGFSGSAIAGAFKQPAPSKGSSASFLSPPSNVGVPNRYAPRTTRNT